MKFHFEIIHPNPIHARIQRASAPLLLAPLPFPLAYYYHSVVLPSPLAHPQAYPPCIQNSAFH